MSNVVVSQGQSLFDIAIQEGGSVDAAFAWALNNNKSVTDNVQTGESLIMPEKAIIDSSSFNYFQNIKGKIATSISTESQELIIPTDRIGYMTIEDTFKINR